MGFVCKFQCAETARPASSNRRCPLCAQCPGSRKLRKQSRTDPVLGNCSSLPAESEFVRENSRGLRVSPWLRVQYLWALMGFTCTQSGVSIGKIQNNHFLTAVKHCRSPSIWNSWGPDSFSLWLHWAWSTHRTTWWHFKCVCCHVSLLTQRARLAYSMSEAAVFCSFHHQT